MLLYANTIIYILQKIIRIHPRPELNSINTNRKKQGRGKRRKQFQRPVVILF